MYTIPNQFYLKTMDWALSYASIHNLPIESIYKVIIPQHTLHLSPPKGVDGPRWSTTCSYNEAFVASIPKGRIVTGNCYAVAPDNKRLQDTEYNYPFTFTNLPDPIYHPGTVATLVWGWNLTELERSTQAVYGHWFFDILPRIHLLEQSGIPIDNYLIGKLTHNFQYESLHMLGIPLDKLIQVSQNDFHLQAQKIVVPAVPLITGKSPKWAYEFIRYRLKDCHFIPPIEGYDKIYVTREDALARYVINENEVMNLLARKGFRKIVLTPLSTQEKVAIYSSAKEIIAPFGSGNINLAFCNPGTKVVELTPYTVEDDYFWRISNHAGLDYYEMVCDIEQPPKYIGGIDNLYVDINKLQQVLQLAGIE